MTTQNILDKWKSLDVVTNPLTSKNIDTFGLKKETADFFKSCGFPYQSAPFLSFVKNSEHVTQTINRLSDLYDLPNEFDKYIVIGSDGSGNPIVINTDKDDRVELLDHEQDFEQLDFMNKNVYTLSGALIEYCIFVKTVQKENGSDAYLDANFSDKHFDSLKSALLSIDKDAAEVGFWNMELNMLKSNRDYYNKNK
jgi:hypothetical protein